MRPRTKFKYDLYTVNFYVFDGSIDLYIQPNSFPSVRTPYHHSSIGKANQKHPIYSEPIKRIAKLIRGMKFIQAITLLKV